MPPSPRSAAYAERYLRRISGLPLPYRLKQIFSEIVYDPPEANITERGGLIAPWELHGVKTHMLMTQDKRLMTEADIQTEFHELTDKYPYHRLLFTDGSKQNTSVACAFTVNNAFFSHKLRDGLSIYTAELVAVGDKGSDEVCTQ